MLYKLITKILFLFDAETVHHFSLNMLSLLHRIGVIRLFVGKPVLAPVEVMGIRFPNAVGLAAGLDKDARHIDALAACGFGFIEVGTVTPLAQTGNDRPRLFRLEHDQAIINRMGFNNDGVDAFVKNVKKHRSSCVIGLNIGKNKLTPLEQAVDDYRACMYKVYPLADYITINISSPNTPGLRKLQHGEGLSNLLGELKRLQGELDKEHGRYVPLAVKVAPDLNNQEIADIATRVRDAGIDAVIATNTTSSRPELEDSSVAAEEGGLSGRPLFALSTSVLKQMVAALGDDIPVIAVGGISSADDAQAKIDAGASLVQIYSGFIYQGPALVRSCAKRLSSRSG